VVIAVRKCVIRPQGCWDGPLSDDGVSVAYVCPDCQVQLGRLKEERECIGCGRPTDTACGLIGDAEYIVSVLTFMGIPEYRADMLIRQDSVATPVGEITRIFRICHGCAATFNLGLDRGPYLRVGPVSSPDSVLCSKGLRVADMVCNSSVRASGERRSGIRHKGDVD
jgi:hypothetical protein